MAGRTAVDAADDMDVWNTPWPSSCTRSCTSFRASSAARTRSSRPTWHARSSRHIDPKYAPGSRFHPR
eukprot:2244318-Prymnesium_polylepis.1